MLLKTQHAEQERNIAETLRLAVEAEKVRVNELTNNLNRERTLVSDLKQALDKDKNRISDLGSALEKERIQFSSIKYVVTDCIRFVHIVQIVA